MKKLVLSALILTTVFSSALFAEKKPKYISPNSDGVQDELSIPLHITDKRYVESWSTTANIANCIAF